MKKASGYIGSALRSMTIIIGGETTKRIDDDETQNTWLKATPEAADDPIRVQLLCSLAL